jgi:hypothetical protein
MRTQLRRLKAIERVSEKKVLEVKGHLGLHLQRDHHLMKTLMMSKLHFYEKIVVI